MQKRIKMSIENALVARRVQLSFINNKISMFIKLSLFVQIRTRLANYSVTQKERSKNEKLK